MPDYFYCLMFQNPVAKLTYMRKILLTVIVIIVTFTVRAQEPADALRYSWTVPGASARIKATGGAMGSLGGDITATFVNPAGLFHKSVFLGRALR